jgi:hypothetical protein
MILLLLAVKGAPTSKTVAGVRAPYAFVRGEPSQALSRTLHHHFTRDYPMSSANLGPRFLR